MTIELLNYNMIDNNFIISIFIINDTDLMLIDNLFKTFGGAKWKIYKPNICFCRVWRCNELEERRFFLYAIATILKLILDYA